MAVETRGSNSGLLACQANSLPIELPRPVENLFGICDQVRLKWACSATETNFEFSKYIYYTSILAANKKCADQTENGQAELHLCHSHMA